MPGGNCFAACVASILELPVGAVPNFCDAEGDWLMAANQWFSKYGLAILDVDLPEDGSLRGINALVHGMPVIISGKSPRGDFDHAVVGEYRRLDDGRHQLAYVHDPHPSNDYLDGPGKSVTLFLATDPSLVAGRGG